MTTQQRAAQATARLRDDCRARFNRAVAQGWQPPAEGGEAMDRSLVSWEAHQAALRAASLLGWPGPINVQGFTNALTAFTLRWEEEGHGRLMSAPTKSGVEIQDRLHPYKRAHAGTHIEALAQWIVRRWEAATSNDPALPLLHSVYRHVL